MSTLQQASGTPSTRKALRADAIDTGPAPLAPERYLPTITNSPIVPILGGLEHILLTREDCRIRFRYARDAAAGCGKSSLDEASPRARRARPSGVPSADLDGSWIAVPVQSNLATRVQRAPTPRCPESFGGTADGDVPRSGLCRATATRPCPGANWQDSGITHLNYCQQVLGTRPRDIAVRTRFGAVVVTGRRLDGHHGVRLQPLEPPPRRY